MSISLIVRSCGLWGLISCVNHTRPWRVPYEMRACEFWPDSRRFRSPHSRIGAAVARVALGDGGGCGSEVRDEGGHGQRAHGAGRSPAALIGLVAADGVATGEWRARHVRSMFHRLKSREIAAGSKREATHPFSRSLGSPVSAGS